MSIFIEYEHLNRAWGLNNYGYTFNLSNRDVRFFDIRKIPASSSVLTKQVAKLEDHEVNMLLALIDKINTVEIISSPGCRDAGTTTITLYKNGKQICLCKRGDTQMNSNNNDVKSLIKIIDQLVSATNDIIKEN